MNGKLPIIDCDQLRLEALLRGDCSQAEERELFTHLDGCSTCRQMLEERAAEAAMWHEARCLLKTSDETDEPSTRLPVPIQTVLAALRPTDDPSRLGRLGGYEISGVVGAGGMGIVLKAVDPSLDRIVAIKVLAPHLATSGAARLRFAREAKAAAAVLHPNVLAIHSVSNDEALPFFVMPYLRGTSLQKRLEEEGPLPLREALRIGSQIAAGLAAAHAQGLVHRDIKPANILLEEGVERVAITDFGLARAVDDASITHSGVIAGTPQYMSPEQARGEPVDQRSDLFSLGSVLYAICTGRPPFRAETAFGVMRRITDEEPKSVREINPDIPPWLCSIIARLMSKHVDDRFASAADVSDLLEQCLAHVQQPTAVPLPDTLTPKATAAGWFSTVRQEPVWRKPMRRKGVISMLGVMSFAFLGLMLWQTVAAPDIAGNWKGEGWGTVQLESKDTGEYEGTYSGVGDVPAGTLQLEWSRLERRFNGTWNEGDVRGGKLSLGLVDDSLRGAYTTDPKAGLKSSRPRLGDLTWSKQSLPLTEKSKPLPEKIYATKEHVNQINELIKSKPVTTNYLAELFELTPGSKSEFRLRKEVVKIPILPGEKSPLDSIPLGNVLYVPATKGFYIQWDGVGASTLHYYGPIYGVSLEKLGLTELPTAETDVGGDDKLQVPIKLPMRLNYFTTGHSITIAASPDGKWIAVANSNPTRILQVGGTSRVKGDWKSRADVINAESGKVIVSLKYTTTEEDEVISATERISHVEATALAFSPVENVIAVGTSIGQVKLFNARNGEHLRTLDDEKPRLADKDTPENWSKVKRAMGSVSTIAFSPDGTMIVTGGGTYREFSDRFDGVGRLGRSGSVSGPGRVKIWDAKTGALLHDLDGHGGTVDSVAFSPDGNLLATAGNWMDAGGENYGTGVILWDPQTGKRTRAIQVQANGGTHSVLFSPNGKLVVIGALNFDKDDDTSSTSVTVARAGTGLIEWQRSIKGQNASPKEMLPNGKGIIVLCKQSVQIIDIDTGGLNYELKATDLSRDGRCYDLTILYPGPRLAVATVDEMEGNIEIWRLGEAQAAKP